MKKMYCITCPTGCELTVHDGGEEPVVEGNGCKRGIDFAIAETTNPTRTLTTTVRTVFPDMPVLPVRTDREIPKDKIMDAMRALRGERIERRLECGDTVAENVADTGVRVIATCDLLGPL